MFVASSLAAAYLLGLIAAHYLEWGDIRRHHIESASFIFTALFVAGILSRRDGKAPPRLVENGVPRWESERHGWWVALGFVVLAFALYAPIIGAGLFADDYVLLEAAREGRWTVWTDFFRPMIFLVWRSLDPFPGDVSPLLHVLNIGLHALNGRLVAVLGCRVGLRKPAAVTAGVLFLSFPAAVEAVAWPAGVQDVLLTSCVLGALVALTASRLTIGKSAACVALVVVAVLTKETGVVAPALALITCAVMRAPRQRWMVALVSLAVVIGTLIVRFTLLPLPASTGPHLSRYAIKELLVRPFSALAIPLRASEIAAMPWLPLLLAAAVIAFLVVAGRRWNRTDQDFHRVLFGAAFVLLAAAPVGRAFFVSDDLLGSRYLYLPAAGWSIALATILSSSAVRSSRVAVLPGTLLIVCWSVLTTVHIQVWKTAGDRRDAILDGAERAVPRRALRSWRSGFQRQLLGCRCSSMASQKL